MIRARLTVSFVIAVTVLPGIAIGHHSHANIDRANIQRHTGVVSEYSWTMPHVYLKVMAPNQHGDVVEYSIELIHPPGMQLRGWSRDSFAKGDRITWEGASDRDPNRYYSGLNWAERGDGTRLTTAIAESAIEASRDFTGVWVRDLRGARGNYEPPSGWPYTPLAQTLVDNFNEDQNPQIQCSNPGPPKATLLPYPIEITRPDPNTIVMNYELRENPRKIYLDSSLAPGAPSAWGHSIGRFENDVLVIETTNFIADRWGTQTGVDSSDQKHLIERFQLSPDGLALEVEMTVTDPVYLTEPVVIDYYMKKLADRELLTDIQCTRDSALLFLEGGL